MAKEAVLYKSDLGHLMPATDYDKEVLLAIKPNSAVKVTITSYRARSLPHHRLYWGGLVPMVAKYYEPDSLITPAEKSMICRFAEWLDRYTNRAGVFVALVDLYFKELSSTRQNSIEVEPTPLKYVSDWIKVNAGYFHYIKTPEGLRKHPKSINFNSMPQDEFNIFYRAAFNVAWKKILDSHFKSEEEAQNAINQLLNMG